MRSRRLTPPVRRTARRWRTPPAILHGGEAFEGAAVLDEMKGPLGVLLFQLARDVYLWANTPPEEREALFQARADEVLTGMLHEANADVQLELALLPLVRMTNAPDSAHEDQVAVACQHVARWADLNGHLETAIAYAQGAAVVLPADAAASFAVGRLARRRAEYARAETWYRRAVALGRQSGDWASYSMAFGGLGNLYAQRGNLPMARRFHLRALRAARRHSLRALHGSALHDLFVLAAQMGQPDTAESLARQAFDAYGTDHPRLVFLAADVAYLWMERGRFAPALTVFQALVHHLRSHEDLITQANMVRAAAGAGERRLFEQTFAEVWDRVTRTQNLDNAAAVMLELAHGATMLGEWDKAERAAERATQVARERGEGKVLLSAEAVVDQVRRTRGLKARIAATPPPPEPETAERAQTFAQDLVRTLNAVLVAG